MKCTKCNTTWTIKSTSAFSDCPKCGSFSKPENIDEALWVLCKTIGMEGMQNDRLLFSAFADVAPELKKERNFLKLFVEAHGPKKIYAVKDADAEQQDNACKAVARDLNENWGMTLANANSVCKAYLHAVVGKVPGARKPAQPKASAAPEVPKIENISPETPSAQPATAPQVEPLGSGGCLLAFVVWIAAFFGMLLFFSSGTWATPLINTIILMIPVTLVILYFIGTASTRNQNKK